MQTKKKPPAALNDAIETRRKRARRSPKRATSSRSTATQELIPPPCEKGALEEELNRVLLRQAALENELAEERGFRARIEQMIRGLHDEIARVDEQLWEFLRDVLVPQAPLASGDQAPGPAYRLLVWSIRKIVRELLPGDSTVLVINKGDDGLLQFGQSRGWHFPQNDQGDYAGYYPESSAAAVTHLEDLRSRGADYLVIPATSHWWLVHYSGLNTHLLRCYRQLFHRAETCTIYSLCESGPYLQLAELMADFKSRHQRYPALLNWESGIDLASILPECAIFTPPEPEAAQLPYLETTIDIVAIGSSEALRRNEARRVAVDMVWVFHGSPQTGEALAMTVERRVGAPECAWQCVQGDFRDISP